MRYWEILTDQEIAQICENIPLDVIVHYFTKHPKDFAKIKPGFRPNKINKRDAVKILITNHTSDFVTSFLSRNISSWIEKIEANIGEQLSDGKSELAAYLYVLPFSPFSNNVRIYFRLIEKNISDELIEMIAESIPVIREMSDEKEKLESQIEELEIECKKNKKAIESKEREIKKASTAYGQLLSENERLAQSQNEILSLKKSIAASEATIRKLERNLSSLEAKILELTKNIEGLTAEKQKLKQELSAKAKKETVVSVVPTVTERKKLKPSNIQEFFEYLEYNFENIGVANENSCRTLLLRYLENILFLGKPILVNRGACFPLIKCISNTLLSNHKKFNCLGYTPQIAQEDIIRFFESSGRIVCLDNFIGNYNETLLFPLLDVYKDKIVFMTMAYEKTLEFVSTELLRYCHYLNLQKITAFFNEVELTEDPSSFSEESYSTEVEYAATRYDRIFRTVLKEIDCPAISSSCVQQLPLKDEESLCAILAYCVFPYCVNVNGYNPLRKSDALQRFILDGRRCSYRSLFEDWFDE